MRDLLKLIWCIVIGLVRSRASLEVEILARRHQLNVLKRKGRSGLFLALSTGSFLRAFIGLDISLSIGVTGSHVPHKSLKQVHAAFMPDAAWAVSRLSPRLIQG
jgi:hypothetical protein